MAKGIVRLVNFERGFGFIAPAQGCNGQVYFHCSTLKEEIFNFLEVGDEVEYDVDLISQGLQAIKVKIPDK